MLQGGNHTCRDHQFTYSASHKDMAVGSKNIKFELITQKDKVHFWESLRPLLSSQAVEYLDACDGALSCMKIMTFLNAEDFFLYH
jgi:hypothetical protein